MPQIIALFFLSFLMSVLWACIMALPVMILWNYAAVVAISGLHTISFMQALGLMVLCQILFKPASASNSKSG